MSQQKLRVATICYKILFDLCCLQLTSGRFMPMVPKCHINTTFYKHQSGTLATCAELVDTQQTKLAKDFTLKPSQLSIALSIFLLIQQNAHLMFLFSGSNARSVWFCTSVQISQKHYEFTRKTILQSCPLWLILCSVYSAVFYKCCSLIYKYSK